MHDPSGWGRLPPAETKSPGVTKEGANMGRARMLGLMVAAALAGGLGYGVWARADTRTPPPARMGKFVLVLDRVTNTALPVERAEVQVLGGKTFLVGVGAAGSQIRTPATGRPVWINLEDASTVIHFDTLPELEKAVADAQPAGREH